MLKDLADHLDGAVINELAVKLSKDSLQQLGGTVLGRAARDFSPDEIADWVHTTGAAGFKALLAKYSNGALRHYGLDFFNRYTGVSSRTAEHMLTTADNIVGGQLKGMHDKDLFDSLFSGPNPLANHPVGEIASRTPHPQDPGIEYVTYRLYKRDASGAFIQPLELSTGVAKEKTVMAGLSANWESWVTKAEAAADEAINNRTLNPAGGRFDGSVGGFDFRGYIREYLGQWHIETFWVVLPGP